METLVLPSLLLVSGFLTDLKTRKVYNWLIVSAFVLGIVHVLYFNGLGGLLHAFGALGLALLLTVPLVLLGMLGAGDMKLLAVLGLMTSYAAVLNVFIYSFIWAAIFGIIYAALTGKLKSILRNIWGIVRGQKIESEKMNRIPFTLPILLGWGTYLLSLHGGGT